MKTEAWPINSITMSLETLQMITRDHGPTIGLGEVLKVVKRAIDEKKPIYIEDKKTGKKYQLLEDSNLLELK